jgi:hypothetical protein
MIDRNVSFQAMSQAFERAIEANAGGVCESEYQFAGQRVVVRVVGRQLWKCLDLPIGHLRSINGASRPPRLHVDLWDQSETGVSCPARKTGAWEPLDEGFLRSCDGKVIGYRLPHSDVILDRVARRIVGWISSAQNLSLYEQGRPLHVPLTVWHNDHGVPVIHAGLVGRSDHGVVLAGAGGSGKSATALACLLAGYDYLSDDLTGLEQLGEGSFVGHSLYGSSFVDAGHLERFPLFRGTAVKGKYPHEEKLLVLLSEFFPTSLKASCQIKAVVLPRVAGCSRSRFYRVSKGEALLALAPSSLITGQISSGAKGFHVLTQLVDTVPSYRLELGVSVEEIPACMNELITGL